MKPSLSSFAQPLPRPRSHIFDASPVPRPRFRQPRSTSRPSVNTTDTDPYRTLPSLSLSLSYMCGYVGSWNECLETECSEGIER